MLSSEPIPLEGEAAYPVGKMVPDEDADNKDAAYGASIVVLSRAGVLMVERARPPFLGLWSFPGGRTDPGETAEETAHRELLEETGLSVSHVVSLGHERPGEGFVLTVFAARSEISEPVAGDDARRAAFVPFGAILELATTPRTAAWIARALAALPAGRDNQGHGALAEASPAAQDQRR